MTPSRQKGRNYRRKPTSNSSPEDSDQEFQHTPPFRVAPSFAHLTSSSAGFGGDNISSATLRKVIVDGDEGSERAAEGGRTSGGDEGGGGGGIGARESDEEVDRSVRASPNGRLDSTGPSTRQGVSQNGGKRIGSGVGYNMLKAMGWRENTGLGQSRKGIVDPILPTAKPNHLGIGFNSTAAHDAAQEEIRQIQKAKREERDRKVQEKLDKAEADEEEAIFMRESFVAVASTSYHENISRSGAGLQGTTSSKPAGQKPTDPGQCLHCKQRFETKIALKSHMNARHARLLLAAKRQLKNKKRSRREGDSKSTSSGRRQSARSLAPLSQNFSVYD